MRKTKLSTLFYYLTKTHQIRKTSKLETWAVIMSSPHRIIKQETVGNYYISTVFLGIDHAFNGGKPILFETMLFSKLPNHQTERYHTWNEALKGHKKWVGWAKRRLKTKTKNTNMPCTQCQKELAMDNSNKCPTCQK